MCVCVYIWYGIDIAWYNKNQSYITIGYIGYIDIALFFCNLRYIDIAWHCLVPCNFTITITIIIIPLPLSSIDPSFPLMIPGPAKAWNASINVVIAPREQRHVQRVNQRGEQRLSHKKKTAWVPPRAVDYRKNLLVFHLWINLNGWFQLNSSWFPWCGCSIKVSNAIGSAQPGLSGNTHISPHLGSIRVYASQNLSWKDHDVPQPSNTSKWIN